MKNVLVTGSTGFIGSEVVRQLLSLAADFNVFTMGRDDNNIVTGLEHRNGDLEKPETLTGVTCGIDTIFHCAGYAHSSNELSDCERQKHIKVNYEGTRSLVKDALESGVNCIVFVSSVKAGGEHSNKCLDEFSEVTKIDFYGSVKRKTEEYLLDKSVLDRIKVVIIRPALVYGPGVKGNLFEMLNLVDKGLFPPLPEIGNRRSMIDVRDLARTIITVSLKPISNGKIYILTDGQLYSTYQIYCLIRKAINKPIPSWNVPIWCLRFLARVGDFFQWILHKRLIFSSEVLEKLISSACYSSERAVLELDFSSRYTLESSLPEMVVSYRKPKG